MKKKWIAAGAALAIIPATVLAQFGFSVVSDPGAYAHFIEQLAATVQIIENAQKLYVLTERAYENVERAAQNITHKHFWMPPVVEWAYPESANTYGTSALWTYAATSGNSASDGYYGAAVELPNYAAVWDELPPTSQNQIARHYGSIELADSSAITALHQVGSVRFLASDVDAAIGRLSDDVESNDPDLNTQVGILNQISAGAVINARQGQNTNQMLATLVDQQTTMATMQRNAMAGSIADDIVARQAAADNRDSIWNGSADGRRQRLP